LRFCRTYMDIELIGILACPSCRSSVTRDGEEIACQGCGRRYPIRDGIPVMLIEDSKVGGKTGDNKE